jgi:hypothetical protein
MSQIDDYSINFIENYSNNLSVNLSDFTISHLNTKYLNESIRSQVLNTPNSQILSQEYTNAMGQLDEIVNNNNKCFEKQSYDDFILTNINNMSNLNEKICLIISANIGYSSLNYWRNNINNWSTFLNNGTINDPIVIYAFVKKIAKADIGGVVTGAIGGVTYGAIGGTMTFPVIGTIAGAAGCGAAGALLGGLGGSCKASVDAFLDWWIK